MRHLFLLFVCVLGFVISGCRHSGIPSGSASHGHLSRSMGDYLRSQDPRGSDVAPGFGLLGFFYDAPTVVLSLEEAREVYSGARKVLLGTAPEAQVKNAVEDLIATCRAQLDEACSFVREHFQRPVKLSGPPPGLTREAQENRVFMSVALRARLGTNGQARDVVVVESAPHGMTEAAIRSLNASKYEPAEMAGHPIEVPYTFTVRLRWPGQKLSKEQELAWARARTSKFPNSPMAWDDLAGLLARDAPEDPGYAPALARAHALRPWSWWPASELAWVRAQEGKYSEAEPLAKVAMREAPEHPYVLETAALVASHQGRCSEAVDLQQRAVAKLPAPWPQEEHARFKQALETYRGQCPAGAAPSAPVNG
ncbi:energy transducer TonB [Myxococcus sp. 1LA]